MKTLTTFLLITAALVAQSAKKKLTFDVVSIKPSSSGGTDERLQGLGKPEGRFSASNVNLRFLIRFAYADPNLPPLEDTVEINGLSGWANTARYDVEAQPAAGVTPTVQQRQEMLQSMLEDRFKLRIRREPKNRPIYALVVDGGGVKMKVSRPPGSAPAPSPGTRPAVPKGGRQFRMISAKMETITGFLTSQAGRKVVDKTGLTGLYDFELTYAPDPAARPGGEVDPNISSLVTALREQLGLRLVAETGSVDTFVVESVQRPTQN